MLMCLVEFYNVQGCYFLENQGMSRNSVLTEMLGNIAVCRGILVA